MSTHQILQILTPKTIDINAKNSFRDQLTKLNADGCLLAAVGVHNKSNKVQISVLPPTMIAETEKTGLAQRKVEFDPNYSYFGQVAKTEQIGALIGEENAEVSPAFQDVGNALVATYEDGTRMVRRGGASKLFVAEINARDGAKQFRVLDSGRNARFAGLFVGESLVTSDGIGAMRTIRVAEISQTLKGGTAKNPWRQLKTPDYVGAYATLGRRGGGERVVLGMKDGRVGSVRLTEAHGEIESQFSDAIPMTKESDKEYGTAIGILPGHPNLSVWIQTDGKDSATISFRRMDTLSEQVQQAIRG